MMIFMEIYPEKHPIDKIIKSAIQIENPDTSVFHWPMREIIKVTIEDGINQQGNYKKQGKYFRSQEKQPNKRRQGVTDDH